MTDIDTEAAVDLVDDYPVYTGPGEAEVRVKADRVGLRLVQLMSNPDKGWWLATSSNWVSYDPPSTLAQIWDRLDIIEAEQAAAAEQRRIADEQLRAMRDAMRQANDHAIKAFAEYAVL